jgi:hypothetical protein
VRYVKPEELIPEEYTSEDVVFARIHCRVLVYDIRILKAAIMNLDPEIFLILSNEIGR